MANGFKSQEERNKIMDRIRKLLSIANGTCYEEEAATALKMAQGWMANYGLSMTDVELSDSLKEDIIRDNVEGHSKMAHPEQWATQLARAVAVVFDVKFFISCSMRKAKKKFHHYHDGPYYRDILEECSYVTFAGYKSDVEMAKLVYTCLYVGLRAAACKQIPVAGKPRLSFMYGAAERLEERAWAEKTTAEAEPTGRFALVVRSKKDNIDTWLSEHVKLTPSRNRGMSLHSGAYEAGRKHGDSVDLMNREKVKSMPQGALGYRKG